MNIRTKRGAPRRISEATQDAIHDDVSSGQTNKYISQKHGCHISYISVLLRRRGIIRKVSAPKGGIHSEFTKKVPVELRPDIIQMWLDGDSFAEIGRELNVSRQRIHQIVTKQLHYPPQRTSKNTKER